MSWAEAVGDIGCWAMIAVIFYIHRRYPSKDKDE